MSAPAAVAWERAAAVAWERAVAEPARRRHGDCDSVRTLWDPGMCFFAKTEERRPPCLRHPGSPDTPWHSHPTASRSASEEAHPDAGSRVDGPGGRCAQQDEPIGGQATDSWLPAPCPPQDPASAPTPGVCPPATEPSTGARGAAGWHARAVHQGDVMPIPPSWCVGPACGNTGRRWQGKRARTLRPHGGHRPSSLLSFGAAAPAGSWLSPQGRGHVQLSTPWPQPRWALDTDTLSEEGRRIGRADGPTDEPAGTESRSCVPRMSPTARAGRPVSRRLSRFGAFLSH